MLARSPLHNPVRNFVSRVWYFLFSIWHLKISAVHLCWIDESCVLIKRKYPCKLRIIWTHCLATKSYISYSNISLWPSCSYFSSECFQLFWEANRAVHRNWESVNTEEFRGTLVCTQRTPSSRTLFYSPFETGTVWSLLPQANYLDSQKSNKYA